MLSLLKTVRSLAVGTPGLDDALAPLDEAAASGLPSIDDIERDVTVPDQLREQVRRLKERGLSIMLAEQNLDFVLALSDYLHILEKGEIKYSGTPDELKASPEVLDQYLTV